METEKTTLQRIMEQKTEQIKIAIEEAIDAGAKIEKSKYIQAREIDGVFVQYTGRCYVVLHFSSDKVAKLFNPTREDLKELAARKRAELEDIEKQIKERGEE